MNVYCWYINMLTLLYLDTTCESFYTALLENVIKIVTRKKNWIKMKYSVFFATLVHWAAGPSGHAV